MAIGYMAGPNYRPGPDDDRKSGDLVPEAAGWRGLKAAVRGLEIVLVYIPDTPQPAKRRGKGRK